MDERIRKIFYFLDLLENENIDYHIGGSCMLQCIGLTDDFYDIDILLSYSDYHKVFQLVKKYPYRIISKTNPMYQTTMLMKVTYHQINLDLIFDFKVIRSGYLYEYPVLKDLPLQSVKQEDRIVPIARLDEWFFAYLMIEREDKADMIEAYLRKNGNEYRESIHRLSLIPSLPSDVKYRLINLLKSFDLQ